MSATLTGVATTIVPAGSLAATTTGDQFRLITAVTIGAGGNVTGNFESVEFGPIAAATGTLTSVVSNVLGWETITNASAATLGIDEQTDASARRERNETLALQSRSGSEAITSRVRAVTGVGSLTFLENSASAPATIEGISMIANSIWACVEGGSNTDIANALQASKTLGTGYNGAIAVFVTDPFSGQTIAVAFDRPTTVNMQIRVTVTNVTNVASPDALIRNILIQYAQGNLVTGAGFVVGADVSPFELAAAVNQGAPSITVNNMEVREVGGVYQSTNFTININQIAALVSGNIDIVIV